MKTILSIFFLITLLHLSHSTFAQNIPIICNQTGAYSDTDFDALIADLKSASFSNQKLKKLAERVYNSSQGFTGDQTVVILKQFSFSSDMAEALKILNLYILGITCEEAANIVFSFSFSSDQIKALENVVNFITDLENNHTIVSQFSFRSDQQRAAEIIAGAIGRSCIYGTVTEKRVQFLVDVSYSMKADFTASNGQRFNRLSFVQKELNEVIRKQLRPDQSFNVFSFAGTVKAWQPGLVPVNSTNIDMAVRFVQAMDFRRDGTNSYEALRRAFQDPDVEAIYFLTDGQPTVGPVTNPDKIIDFVRQWNKNNIPIHCTAFLSGYYTGDDKPAAKKFMHDLAEATRGIYRSIE